MMLLASNYDIDITLLACHMLSWVCSSFKADTHKGQVDVGHADWCRPLKSMVTCQFLKFDVVKWVLAISDIDEISNRHI